VADRGGLDAGVAENYRKLFGHAIRARGITDHPIQPTRRGLRIVLHELLRRDVTSGAPDIGHTARIPFNPKDVRIRSSVTGRNGREGLGTEAKPEDRDIS